MNVKLLALCFLIGYCVQVSAQKSTYLLVNEDRLLAVKKRIENKESQANDWLKGIVKDADKLLESKPGSVMDKNQTPPSGNKHDYMSLAPYYWPDPTKPNGLPYIRKDGEHNPEIHDIKDHECSNNLEKAVKKLALAYYFTHKEQYATKAATYLQVWFLDSATKMNPNLNYAQAVKGVNDGRGIGIIETSYLVNVLNSVQLLKGSPSWSDKENTELQTWVDAYLQWMLINKNGLDEQHAKNNHGIWYDTQILGQGIYLGKLDFVKEYINKTTIPRIAQQMEADGKQPLELERATALGYSTFCLEAWFTAAILAEKVDIDIWNYTSPDGKSIKKAFDWLLPFAMGEKPWNYQQSHPYKKDKLYYLLLQAAKHYKNESYYQLAASLDVKNHDEIVDIFYSK